jgi:putative transposase
MLKSYKYKLNPNEEQKVLLNKHFGSIRFAYNYFLNERKREYETNKQSLNYYDNARALTELKKQEEYYWLNEINSQSLQVSLKHLDDAYNGFFKKRTGFPKFKSKHNKNSFKVPQFVKLINGKLKIPKFDQVIDVILHRTFSGKIKQCTISKTTTNEYFVSILVETEHKKLEKTGKGVGIDLGLKDFVITSDGYKYKNNRYTKTYQTLLRKAQQHLSRKTKGSKLYELQRLKVAKLHKKITNSRLDNLHKVSTDLIRKYDLIVLEDLNIKGMIKNHKLSKHIADASWSKFIELLTYKTEWNDKQIVRIDRFFPSSKTCNCCGYINQNLDLSVREWTCPSCKTKLDRDLNASKNILNEGYKLISDGTSDYRSGDEIRPIKIGTIDETSKILNIYISEAHESLVRG